MNNKWKEILILLAILAVFVYILGRMFSNEYLDPRSPHVPIQIKPYPWEE